MKAQLSELPFHVVTVLQVVLCANAISEPPDNENYTSCQEQQTKESAGCVAVITEFLCRFSL